MPESANKDRVKRWLRNPTNRVFLAIVGLLVVWFVSGIVGRSLDEPADAAAVRVPAVAASWREAELITREIVIYGDVMPTRIATLRARVDGIVEHIVDSGTRVDAGEVVAVLSSDDREARLARARAQLRSAEQDFDAVAQLAERGVTPRSEVEVRLAQLEAARADLRSIELEIANTQLRAPIGGDVNQLIADIGAYVSVGGEVLDIVDNDPLLAVVQVHQADIARVRRDMPAEVRFIGGQSREGAVRFVAPVADAGSRTFRVEIEIDNPERNLPSGLSAEVVIPTDEVLAQRVSPALLRLDTQGRIGVHLVDDEQRIQFVPVTILKARADGLWVGGLPDPAHIVTISQGALIPGQQVEVRETPAEFMGVSGMHDGEAAETN